MPDSVEKTSDEIKPKKSSGRIFIQEVEEGLDALHRSVPRLAISAFAAGLELGLSLLVIAIMVVETDGYASPYVREILVGAATSFGFIAVILGRSELFTEQTTLAILPLLSRNATVAQVARLWGVVYAGNLAGAAASAAFIVLIGPALHDMGTDVFSTIAHKKVDHAGWIILLSGVLAGWIMGLLSWLVAAGRDTISQIVIIGIFSGVIGLAHLHHCILGSTIVLAGVFAGSVVTLADFGHFLLWATLGNAVGGACFVAILKFGHARRNTHE